MGDAISTLINKLSDPSIQWYIWSHFGRRVYGNITGTNQTLAICDDMICLPVRFSEYIRWFNPVANSPANRVFNLSEAWDHTNETNPTTSYPLCGTIFGILGYGGYLIAVHLTDNTNMVVVHIARKYNQLLITNMGYYIRDNTRYNINVPVKVLFPPSILGLTYTTNGTVESDGIIISSGKYVLFYPSEDSPFSIDATNGVFATSPIGTNPTYARELRHRGWARPYWNAWLPSFYLGIPAPDGIHPEFSPFSLIEIRGSVIINRGGINVAGVTDLKPFFDIYSNDPHCAPRTWAGDKQSYTIYIGYAVNDKNNVVFLLASGLAFKHTTRKELMGEISKTILYDAIEKEMYILGWIKPSQNIYSYGRGGAVWTPSLYDNADDERFYLWGESSPSRIVYVKPDDTVGVYTSPPATTLWEYTDAYGFCEIWSDKALCYEILALYTNDAITINPKDSGFSRRGGGVMPMTVAYDQIKAYMDRWLLSNRTYFAMARVWWDQGNQLDDYYASRIKKYMPRIITPDEWSNLVTFFPPFTLNIIGGAPQIYGRYIEFTIDPPNPKPGQPFTISGSVRLSPSPTSPPLSNAKIIIIITDPDTNTATLLTSVQADANGRFSATLNAPETPKNYKILVIARPQT